MRWDTEYSHRAPEDTRNIVRVLYGKIERDVLDVSRFEQAMGMRPIINWAVPYNQLDKTLEYRRHVARTVMPRGETLWEQVVSLIPDILITSSHKIEREARRTRLNRDTLMECLQRIGVDLSRRPQSDYLTPEELRELLLSAIRARIYLDDERHRRAVMQAERELPILKTAVRDEIQFRRGLAYVMCRTVLEDKILDPGALNNAEGLDSLTHALLSLKCVADICRQRLNWLQPPGLETLMVTRYSSVSLDPDALVASRWSACIAHYRSQLRSLEYDILRDACVRLKDVDWYTRAFRPDKRTTKTYQSRLDKLLSERLLLSLDSIGLQMRAIFTPRLRTRFRHIGVVEAAVLEDDNFRRAYCVIEPNGTSFDCRAVHPDAFDVVVERETISMRADLYVPGAGWTFEPWKECSFTPERSEMWLYRECPTQNGSVRMTDKMARLLSILWAHGGGPLSRRRLLTAMGLRQRTIDLHLAQLRENRVASVIYHPRIDYAGLPVSVLVALRSESRDYARAVSRWLMSVMPYVHLFSDRAETSLFAEVWVPPYRGGLTVQVINKRISEMNSTPLSPYDQGTSLVTQVAQCLQLRSFRLSSPLFSLQSS